MCHYDVALFPSAVVALALLSIDLESLTQDAAKWTCISGQLQVMSKITTDELMKCRHKIMEILSDDVYDDRDDISDVGNDEKEDSSKLVYPPQHTLHHDYTHHNDVVMEDTASDGYDTDNTLTASEGEGDENQDLSKPPTYAEIVKSGKTKLEEACGNLPCKVEEFTPPVNKRCGMQASCYFRPSSMLDVDCMRYPGEGFKLQTAK
uniref:Uncharacterized LOC100185492 n=1 Tax=Ciona intestinalis TaxID=7719 RepID=F6UA53_CIOIN|nr:uncharacterized protein LOC100185492 [Ciona intestinalis]|eukprot:XP_002124258.2 uncharacterized protein LOC100185492 [Ciona intestinalis]